MLVSFGESFGTSAPWLLGTVKWPGVRIKLTAGCLKDLH